MDDIQRLLAGRKLVDSYRLQQATTKGDLATMFAFGLNKLGFSSIGEFFDFNKEMNKAETKACIEIVGECDQCRGRQRVCTPTVSIEACYRGRTVGATRALIPDLDKNIDSFMNLRKFWGNYQAESYVKVGGEGHIIPGCSVSYRRLRDANFNTQWM